MTELPEMMELYELRLPLSPKRGDGCGDGKASEASEANETDVAGVVSGEAGEAGVAGVGCVGCVGCGLLVRLFNRDGGCGWGIGLPRKKLTGETIESMCEDIKSIFWPAICSADTMTELAETVYQLPSVQGERIITAARCAVETATINACDIDWFEPLTQRCDSWQNLTQGNLDLIPTAAELIAADSVASALARLNTLIKARRSNIRVILTGDDELDPVMIDEIARRLRKTFDDGHFHLYADVNCHWKYNEVSERAKQYAALGCCALRDPCPVRVGVLSHLAFDCPLPIIADISCITGEQLDVALGAEGRIWPLISVEKCGGLTLATEMALSCASARTPWVLGCDLLQDGLTTLIQRTMLNHAPPPCLIESGQGFDRLSDDIIHPRPRCGLGGRVPMQNSDFTMIRPRGDKFAKYARLVLRLDRDTH